ncbi:MAG: helix-turn-helix transcriptional regulator [Oscillospiraceae bacterium]|nr:helix-turn-helix transcriptional regulator [Oscillospiraceae bacterium]MBQ3880543.1 helix-turn-helix transcriptional regulator [Oscillospiraceae bacterium]
MAKKVGTLIKEARTAAGLTQEQLAKKVAGLSASDLSKAERGEKNLTQEQLKAIAKATGVTQKSLLDAAKGTSTSSSSSSSASKTSSSMKLTAAEKKLVEAYRKADDETKKKINELLKEKEDDDSPLSSLLNSDVVNSLLTSALGAITGKK